MDQYITPDRIANAIMQDKSFKGMHVLVEGVKDLKVYSKFFDLAKVRLTQTGGKYKQREAYNTLSARGFQKAIGIRDADFFRIKDNPKFVEGFKTNIFMTDGHDSEIMMIMVDTLEDMLSVCVEYEGRKNFEEKISSSIREVVISGAYKLGCLKLANKRYNLGLSFKPEKVDGNRLKFKKFINENDFHLDLDKMIHTVWEYSKNRGQVVSNKDLITKSYSEVYGENHPSTEIVNGHDVAEIICIVASQGIKSKNTVFQHPDRVEESLALSFDRMKFRRTSLYQALFRWLEENEEEHFFSLD
ncbi:MULTISPECIES: DUF4435 domain-containing protein [Pantoea]|jgi:hypothetical protein|uniref:DUF4435 domain-containing protein n=1 Tax=Pantoea TaxID=53335 RepID=UPI000F08D07C|nr:MULTISPECIES: DUF4435 domain-containing protein [Pantoea]RNA75432.1 hypothetical protein EBO33_16740 [[Curtobacterium] plantarum]